MAQAPVAAMFSPRVRRSFRTIIVLFSWYCISTSIILITKWVLSGQSDESGESDESDESKLFSFPLTVTTFSNSLTSVWAFLVSRHPNHRPERLTRRQFKEYVLPIGAATAMEIGFSNVALKLLAVSFGTILKGGAPVFTMMWGLLLGIETYSGSLCLSLITIVLGIGLASLGEGDDFAVLGFILQLSATALGGLRWAMTHVLLKGDSTHRMPPVTATLYTSPTTAACVLPFALFLEGRDVLSHLGGLKALDYVKILAVLTVIATLVFILLVSEYWLVSETSSLALSVAGIFKELLTILGGVVLFREHLSSLNAIGFVVCQIGIAAYVYMRYDPNDVMEINEEMMIPDTHIPHTYGVVSDDAASDDVWNDDDAADAMLASQFQSSVQAIR